jgi:hypothetical protein
VNGGEIVAVVAQVAAKLVSHHWHMLDSSGVYIELTNFRAMSASCRHIARPSRGE